MYLISQAHHVPLAPPPDAGIRGWIELDCGPLRRPMGLLENIFFRDWPRPLETGSLPDLTLDLNGAALGPFAIDHFTQKLKDRLGPPANWRRWKNKRQWHYPELGMWFESSKEGELEMINLIVREENNYAICPGWIERWKPWSGSIRFQSGDILPALSAKSDDFIKWAGDPDDRYDDKDEHEFYYCEEPRFTNFGFDVEFTSTGELSGLEIYSQRA